MFNNHFKHKTKEGEFPDYKDLIIKTEAAYSLNNQALDYERLISFLDSNDQTLKYYALLNIDSVKTVEDAQKILSYLKDNDTRIRELSSGLIKNLLSDCNQRQFFNTESSIEILIESIKDTNPRVCRNITHSLHYIDNRLTIIKKIIKIIETENTFTTYWGLNALDNILVTNTEKLAIIIEEIVNLIIKTSQSNEYQIREKTAFIVKTLTNKEVYRENITGKLKELSKKLSEDENFYVRSTISRTD